MSEFSFEWQSTRSLKRELQSPVVRASMPEISHDMAFAISLWRADGTALDICSKMHDVGYRQEVGVLSFEIVPPPHSDKYIIDLPDYYLNILEVKKLKIREENGIAADSGIVLEMKGDHELIVVAGGFPCSIAVCGLPELKNICEPEWPIERYDRENFTE